MVANTERRSIDTRAAPDYSAPRSGRDGRNRLVLRSPYERKRAAGPPGPSCRAPEQGARGGGPRGEAAGGIERPRAAAGHGPGAAYWCRAGRRDPGRDAARLGHRSLAGNIALDGDRDVL